MEYKQQKEELNYYIEMEDLIKKEAEKEVKSRLAKEEIAYFQQRVRFHLFKMFLFAHGDLVHMFFSSKGFGPIERENVQT